VVPFVRGRERSRPAAEVLREMRQLVDRGVREITLLGQNVNSYGRGLTGAPSFPALLRMAHEVNGLTRLRFTTSHPKDMTDDLCRAFAELPKLANHVHLPVQSGSDAVLRRMGRGYDVARYLDRAEKLRAARPDIAITTDLLVGFPGETDADFAATMALAESVRWSNAFSFRYSARPGTAAAGLADDVPETLKIERLMALQDVLRRITAELHQELVGREVRVVVEKKVEDVHPYPWSGKSGCYREIHFQGDGLRIGDLATVACEKAFANHLFGRATAVAKPRA
jgi:tRNA-2-methylthio-N6-dimethylallyladenosine synthase